MCTTKNSFPSPPRSVDVATSWGRAPKLSQVGRASTYDEGAASRQQQQQQQQQQQLENGDLDSGGLSGSLRSIGGVGVAQATSSSSSASQGAGVMRTAGSLTSVSSVRSTISVQVRKQDTVRNCYDLMWHTSRLMLVEHVSRTAEWDRSKSPGRPGPPPRRRTLSRDLGTPSHILTSNSSSSNSRCEAGEPDPGPPATTTCTITTTTWRPAARRRSQRPC